MATVYNAKPMQGTLRSKNLVKAFGSRTVVNNVSIEVKTGEVVGLLGPNGAGKTTTFYMTVGLLAPDKGSIWLNDKDITREPMYRRAQIGVGYLPQEASVFRKMSVEDNIAAILETMPLTLTEIKSRTDQLLGELGLTHVRKSLGGSLSGGERRRVEIARSLARDPSFMLLDEPFAGIDPIVIRDIQQIIGALRNRGIGVLITDHNVRETLGICDRAYILVDGKVFEEGTPLQISNSDQARRHYLGADFRF